MKAKELYHVAIYLRLSRGDKDIDSRNKFESNSISSQRDLARAFIRQHKDMQIYDIYVDDGFSGTNFDRPEFKRMMKDVYTEKVDCIIVKDLSRFGRDYIEVGRLIQRIFPILNVRFIAIIDNFDSLTADRSDIELVLPVRNFINSSYCRDISQKVRSHQRIKRENGEFIGAFAVYGYKKNEQNKNRLIPDEYAAGVVKNIFAWKIEGMSTLAIANRLNKLGILSPFEYKKLCGEKFTTSFGIKPKSKWSAMAVGRILTNETYMGMVVQGKEEKINYKVGKSIKKPKNEWIRVENMHEKVVSKEDFELVQKLLLTDTRAANGEKTSHIFSGLLFCGDCKKNMLRRVNRYKEKSKVYFICQTRNKGKGCTRHSIEELELTKIVLHSVRTYVALFLQKSEQLAYIEQMEIDFKEVAKLDKELTKLYKEKEKYFVLKNGLYKDLEKNIITEEDFNNFNYIYKEQYKETERTIKEQKQMRKELLKSSITAGINLEKFKQVLTITNLDRNTLITFVNRIDIYEDKRVEITFQFQEQFEKIVVLLKYLEKQKQKK